MLLDQARQHLDRQIPCPDRPHQLGGDRIAFGAAMGVAGEHVAPPLQPDFAGQGLRDLVAHPRDLDVESIEREQRAANIGGHENRRGIAGGIMTAHQIGAERGRVLVVGDRLGHGTAISAAATRRRSPSMML